MTDKPSHNRIKYVLLKPWLIPDFALTFIKFEIVANRTYSQDYTWFDALFCHFGIDRWSRLAAVTRQIKQNSKTPGPVSVLDAGGGSGTIKHFLEPAKYDITVLDLNKKSLEEVRDSRIGTVQGNACVLPFKDKSFDVVISVDSLEHVPEEQKNDYCTELKRVAKKYVIVHCPCDSRDGTFNGTNCDSEFQRRYHAKYHTYEFNTAQHLESGLPKVEDLKKLFPGASLTGTQNKAVWLDYMIRGLSPYVRQLNGLIYKIKLQKKDNLPPFHCCLLVWHKGSGV